MTELTDKKLRRKIQSRCNAIIRMSKNPAKGTIFNDGEFSTTFLDMKFSFGIVTWKFIVENLKTDIRYNAIMEENMDSRRYWSIEEAKK